MEVNQDEFKKFNLKVAKIKAVKKHPKSDDYVLLIDIGRTGADKQLVANLKNYKMDDLIGRRVLFLQNTEPIVVKGIESSGLLLTVSKSGRMLLLEPPKGTCLGARISGLNNKEISFKE